MLWTSDYISYLWLLPAAVFVFLPLLMLFAWFAVETIKHLVGAQKVAKENGAKKGLHSSDL